MTDSLRNSPLLPEPLPYQREMVEYLKSDEAELWRWFADNPASSEHADPLRLDLLKATYRVDRDTQPELYAAAAEIAARLEIGPTITFYQSQEGGAMNAGVVRAPGEAHIVLSGPVLDALDDSEQRAMLGHELGHYRLLDAWDGEYRIAAELLQALANDEAAEEAHILSDRLYRLYAEIFSDRAAYYASEDETAAITTLLKLNTGVKKVSARSYLKQAEEIFSKSRDAARELTHPEPYIRARALHLWAETGTDADEETAAMIEGPPVLDRLDLLGRRRVSSLTRRVISSLLAPEAMRTSTLLGHARSFFADFEPPANGRADAELNEALAAEDPGLRDFYCYTMLDFVAVDRELEDLPFASALLLSRKLGLGDRFGEIASAELGLSSRRFRQLEKDAEEVVAAASG